MVKEAVYTFKRLKHYKPFDSTFFRLAKIGIHSAKQFYSTTLYTDKNSYKFLKDGGLEFDKVIFSDSIEKYQGANYAMPKILTMIDRTEPYIHLDFDSILISKPEDTATVSFPFPEPDLTNISTHNPYEFVYIAYVESFLREILDKIDYNIQKRLKWDIFPNNSALIVNNPTTVSNIFKEVINDFSLNLIEKVNPTSVEQQYFLSYLDHYGIDYSFRNTSDTFNIIDYREFSENKKQYYLDAQKYVHMSHYSWWPEISNEVLDFYSKKLNFSEKKVSI